MCIRDRINTPHRGCIFADYLLEKIPEKIKQKVAQGYNCLLYTSNRET